MTEEEARRTRQEAIKREAESRRMEKLLQGWMVNIGSRYGLPRTY